MLIIGSNIFQPGYKYTYYVTGIPVGGVFNSTVLPAGWSVFSMSAITAGNQTFVLTAGAASGSLVFIYTISGDPVPVSIFVLTTGYKKGEEIKQDMFLVTRVPNVKPAADVCGEVSTGCPFNLEVFADPGSPASTLNNDKSDFYFYGDEIATTAISIVLQKNTSSCGDGTWEDKATISDQTYGQFFAYGNSPDFLGNTFVDDYGKKYTGVFLEWLLVHAAFGVGMYRIKVVYTTGFSGVITNYSDAEYCLHLYDCHKINGTVRIETLTQGLRGTMADKQIQIDYFTGWNSQIRLKGIFYEIKPTYVKEYNQYGDSSFNSFKPLIAELNPKFTMDIKPHPGWVDWYLSNNVLLADEILVTDYNLANRKVFIQTPVINEAGVETKDADFVNSNAWSQVNFTYGQNNLRKINS